MLPARCLLDGDPAPGEALRDVGRSSLMSWPSVQPFTLIRNPVRTRKPSASMPKLIRQPDQPT